MVGRMPARESDMRKNIPSSTPSPTLSPVLSGLKSSDEISRIRIGNASLLGNNIKKRAEEHIVV